MSQTVGWLGLKTKVEVGSVKAAPPSWKLRMYAFSLIFLELQEL